MSSIEVVSKTETQIVARATLGAHIAKALNESINVARVNSKTVVLTFNGQELHVTGDNTVDELLKVFDEKLAAAAAEYEKSPEYKQRQLAQKQRLIAEQAKIDVLIEELDNVLNLEPSLVAWIGAFASVNDNIHLVFDSKAIIAKLESAGYVRNDCLGEPVTKNDQARWLIGQAIDHLASGMPMHPGLKYHADKYAAL